MNKPIHPTARAIQVGNEQRETIVSSITRISQKSGYSLTDRDGETRIQCFLAWFTENCASKNWKNTYSRWDWWRSYRLCSRVMTGKLVFPFISIDPPIDRSIDLRFFSSVRWIFFVILFVSSSVLFSCRFIVVWRVRTEERGVASAHGTSATALAIACDSLSADTKHRFNGRVELYPVNRLFPFFFTLKTYDSLDSGAHLTVDFRQHREF